jgi:hypothetical protein
MARLEDCWVWLEAFRGELLHLVGCGSALRHGLSRRLETHFAGVYQIGEE